MTLLLDAGANPNLSSDLLHLAALTGDLDLVKPLKIDVNQMDDTRGTPLYAVAEAGLIDMIEYFLEQGADINAISKKRTPLLQAAIHNKYDSVKVLLQQHADPNHIDTELDRHWYWMNISALHSCVHHKTIDMAKLLLEAGANPNVTDDLLRLAVSKSNLEMVKVFCEANINLDAVDNWGTATYAAAAEGKLEILKYLLDQGADPNIEGGAHKTPLNAAAAGNHQDCILELLGGDSAGEE
jgi:ankyrin repeat protein